MAYHRGIDRLLLVLVPAGFFIYMSIQPVTTFRPDMPPQFVDYRPNAGSAQRAAEERLARAYWDLFVTETQYRYPRGSALPASPPNEFQLGNAQPPGAESLASSRVRYWHRLQHVWLLPSSWVTSRKLSLDWLVQPIVKATDWIKDYLKGRWAS